MADPPNYHILLWPEPPGPPTYLCQICPAMGMTELEVRAHVLDEHGVAPVPTLIAEYPPVPIEELRMAATPTYRVETTEDGPPIYHCLYCAGQGTEHHARDLALFTQHMQQRHDGRMVEAPPDAQAQPAPADPEGGPSGQTGDDPGQAPPPAHPSVLPDDAGETPPA